jgi:hypothetical protein
MEKLYSAALRIARSLPRRRHALSISLDAHHLSVRTNDSGDKKAYITDTTTEIQNAHPLRDARSAQDPFRDRLNDASLD